MNAEMKPMLSKASTLLKEPLLDDTSKFYQYLSPLEALQYPPLVLLK